MTFARVLRDAAVLVLMGAWAVAAHFGSAGVGSPDFNAAVAMLPIAGALAMLVWRLPNRWLVIGGYVAGCALLVGLWPRLRHNVALLYYLQHLGVHLALGVLFGKSLLGPGEALVTQLARHIFNGRISERNARYTRQVTVGWTVFFFANAMVSTGLFWLAPPAIWSIHANLLTGPLIGLMFVAEHLWRMRVLPPEERPSIATAIRAYRDGRAQDDTPASVS